MLNLINSIGVLLIIGGFTCFVLGAIQAILPAFQKMVPAEFKKFFTMQTGGLIFLTGLVFVYIG